MHAVVFRVTLKDRETAEQFLKDQLVPAAKQAPGFVSGTWVALGGQQGTSIVVFESEDAAKQWAQPGSNDDMPPAEIVEINSVEIGEVTAQA